MQTTSLNPYQLLQLHGTNRHCIQCTCKMTLLRVCQVRSL